ncbi:MAG: FAD-dependent oxidoreductase [Planctomycetota bacterium]
MSGDATANSTAIIGAGVAGLTCAQHLAGAGYAVTVFEKSRGVSGRLSTRRVEGGLAFDHGAQYFTARDPRFINRVTQWRKAGVAAEWTGRIATLNQGVSTVKQDNKTRLVGTPDMPAVCRHMAGELDVKLKTRVTSLKREASRWQVHCDGGGAEDFDRVLLAIPAPQASELLGEAPGLRDQVLPVTMQSCWAVMAAFEQPVDVPLDGAFVEASPLSWIARNSSKPGRPSSTDAWVLHGSHEWSEANLEIEPQEAKQRLLDAFWQSTGAAPRTPAYATAHRWRYAIPPAPLGERALYDPALGIGVAGDWCGGPRVEGAFLSGLALAEAVTGAA